MMKNWHLKNCYADFTNGAPHRRGLVDDLGSDVAPVYFISAIRPKVPVLNYVTAFKYAALFSCSPATPAFLSHVIETTTTSCMNDECSCYVLVREASGHISVRVTNSVSQTTSATWIKRMSLGRRSHLYKCSVNRSVWPSRLVIIFSDTDTNRNFLKVVPGCRCSVRDRSPQCGFWVLRRLGAYSICHIVSEVKVGW